MPEEIIQHELTGISIETLAQDMMGFVCERLQDDQFVGVLITGGYERRDEVLRMFENGLTTRLYREGRIVERLDLTDSNSERRTAEEILAYQRKYPGSVSLIYDPDYEIVLYGRDLNPEDLSWAKVLRERGAWPPSPYNLSLRGGLSNCDNVYSVDLLELT